MSKRNAAIRGRAEVKASQPPAYSCPPELRTCVVWDWLEPDEAADVERHGMNSMLVIRAWRRWQDARRDYASRVGMSELAVCGPMGRPTLDRL
ncbi:hypothetical protein ABZX69_15945 [Streptomyces sp. NPDC004074]|uniref:hypothetical protein n=1 Tax=Streptomyces sp. NPDC004074 TaxID=3154277 RepID=UPI0033B8F3B5